MEMPNVSECSVEECAYNKDSMCHAMAITIGDSVHPRCDTFCTSVSMGLDTSCMAGVGACKTTACSHNLGLECGASGISVGINHDEIDCLTFEGR
jgi:hypothetical protein